MLMLILWIYIFLMLDVLMIILRPIFPVSPLSYDIAKCFWSIRILEKNHNLDFFFFNLDSKEEVCFCLSFILKDFFSFLKGLFRF